MLRGDKGADPVGVGAGVVAQGPADRLADEELPPVRREGRCRPRRTVEVGLDRQHQQVPVEPGAGADLADDRRTSYPQVVGDRPPLQHGPDLLRVGQQQVAHKGAGDLVHEVPPRAGADEVLVEAEQFAVPVLPAVARQRDRGVALLPELRVVPQGEHGRSPGALVRERVRGQDRAEDPLEHRGRDASKGHRRLHVGLHRAGLLGIAAGGQRVADEANEVIVCGHGVHTRVEEQPGSEGRRRSDRRTIRAHRRRRPRARGPR